MDSSAKPRIVFMGTPEFATGPLKALMDGGYDIAAVVTVPDKPSGRGLKMNYSAVKQYLLSNSPSTPLLQPERLTDPGFRKALKKLKADLFVVVAFRILPKAIWSLPPLGTFNLHASLLPKYRGAAPINWAIMNGETETGVTTFLLDKHIDTGAILFQKKIHISQKDNVGILYNRLMRTGGPLVVHTVRAIARRRIISQPQDIRSFFSSAPKITREIMEIDWERHAIEIYNKVRGLNPYPSAHTVLRQGDKIIELKIFSTSIFSRDWTNEKAGKVHSDGKNKLIVSAGVGKIEILELQVAGKRRMTTREFLAGWHTGWEDVYLGANL